MPGQLVTARVTIAQQRLTELVAGPTGMVVVWVDKVTNGIRNRAVLYAPVDTGRLRASIVTVKARAAGMVITGSVGSDVEYARPVHDGLTKREVVVKEHTSHSRLGKTYTVSQHTRSQKARAPRPYLTRAMTEELAARGAIR